MIIKKPKYFKKIAIDSVNPYSRFHGELSKYRLHNIVDNVDNSKNINDIYLEY
ncbi:hypothetical protein [Apibacter mensalis]|uniref:hypothetical protein n=1 Tax=Apibacter mensalis TaxID=1586267 RepID=UPI0026EEFF9B|nr:hypothetical protein [Apibacter mensalis]